MAVPDVTDLDFERCMDVLRSVHADHNLRHYLTAAGIMRHPGYVEVRYRNEMATFDGDELTRLVIAAHCHRVRVSLSGRAKYVMTVLLHPRQPSGHLFDRHPGTERLAAQR
jgi:hypothetical protein